MSSDRQRLAEARRAVHESLTLYSAPEADRIKGLIALLEEAVRREALGGEICEIPHESTEEEEECEQRRLNAPSVHLKGQLAEARMWARHGYEIGQRHCGWADHGVAPVWLTEGWPNSFETCPHMQDGT